MLPTNFCLKQTLKDYMKVSAWEKHPKEFLVVLILHNLQMPTILSKMKK